MFLDAIARALQLDEAEHAHLHDLAHAADTISFRRGATPKQQMRPVVQRILDGITAMPAIVMNGHFDLRPTDSATPSTHLCTTMTRPAESTSPASPSSTPHATGLYPDWDLAANTTVAMLRTEAGRRPYDRALTDLIGELSTVATPSAIAGRRTTFCSTRSAPSASTTPSSVTSASPTKSWNSPPTPASP